MEGLQGGPGPKVFCIGRNKTGTTSLKHALSSLGYCMGLQAGGEMLLHDWAQRDFRRIIRLCRTADAFQDLPFSLADTYRAVDAAFPGSKFILTVRDHPEQWYESVVRFQTQIVGAQRTPTADDLQNHGYRYPGFLWEAAQLVYGVTAERLFDRELYITHYQEHNRQVLDYFRQRPQDLLLLNVGEPDAMERLCIFLGHRYQGQPMPHRNRSARRKTSSALAMKFRRCLRVLARLWR